MCRPKDRKIVVFDFFFSCNFFTFLIIKALDPYRIGSVRIGIQPKMLDPDSDSDDMNADPQPWYRNALYSETRV